MVYMKLKNIVCALFISLVLASSIGCLAKETSGIADGNLTLPKEDLPEGFYFFTSLPDPDGRVNMTDEIGDFYGELDIDPVDPANISVGIYKWADSVLDAKITMFQLSGEEKADNAISNFKSQYDEMVARGLPILSNATVNGHPSLQIKDVRGDNSIRYLFLWRAGSLVTLVEGNQDRNQSLELAEATGL
jgi:hypothetical protein